MAHKTLIGGTAYEVSGGKTLIGGTGYEISGGKTLIGGTGYDISFSPCQSVFADNDWTTIIWACQNNAVPETWKVGDQKAMTINDVDFMIDIIGKNHDTYSDGSGTAPLTFQTHDCYGKYNMNGTASNSYGWTACYVRSSYLPNTVTPGLPTEVQNALREVAKKTSVGSKSSTISTTADKLFLLSEIEIFGSITQSMSGEGSQYDYYKAGNSKVKALSGTAVAWYERSPRAASTSHYCGVSGVGEANYLSATVKQGISFAFCF